MRRDGTNLRYSPYTAVILQQGHTAESCGILMHIPGKTHHTKNVRRLVFAQRDLRKSCLFFPQTLLSISTWRHSHRKDHLANPMEQTGDKWIYQEVLHKKDA